MMMEWLTMGVCSVRNGTDPVQVKSCSVPAGKGGNILCRTDEMPAPAGWQGDAVIGNDEPY